ncbi:MAG: accessory factor UbiK family protein [Gammaproteobacteria bacterium]|nr:accessory factor UbiK family protein [Gammaproteobacteria bacterium]
MPESCSQSDRGSYAVTDSLRLDNLIERIAGLLPRMSGPAAVELRKNLRAMLTSALASMDLVTREEFDVQTTVLARTRARLEELERQVAALEQALGRPPAPPGG